MKTFLKILLLLVIAALVIHFWPVAAVPIVIGLVIGLAVFGILAGSIAVVLSIVACLALALIGAAVGIIAALSPIWLPILFIVGIVALVRSSSRQTA